MKMKSIHDMTIKKKKKKKKKTKKKKKKKNRYDEDTHILCF